MSGSRFPIHPGDEERLAADMGRELEELGDVHGVRPSAGFADRVMAAIEDEPMPQPGVVLGLALRRRRLGLAFAAFRDSWRVAFGGPRPFAVRAQALALVLVVAVAALGTGGVAVVGASRLLGLDSTPAPSVQPSPLVSPSPSIVPSPSPTPSPTPSATPSPSPSATPTETPEATETAEPTETPDESDDHGGGDGSGSGSDDDSSGPGSGSDDDKTQEPDDHTPDPTDDD